MNGPSSPEEQEMWYKVIDSVEPMDTENAIAVLKETANLLDNIGVTFFLRQGTCLGAIREGTIISWDDDIDLGSIIRLHGFTEESIESAASILRKNGFIAKVTVQDLSIQVILVKSFIRIDWVCYKILDNSIYQYPAVKTPVGLFKDLKKIQFLGREFNVPNPPEEYLRLKYGEDWRTPKQSGSYEKDVLNLIKEGRAPGRSGWLSQWITRYITGKNVSRLGVFDKNYRPVPSAEVFVVGVGTYRTNKSGYARLFIPESDDYALVIRFGSHEELLYMERIDPGKTYTYKADPQKTSGRYGVLVLEEE